LVLELAGKRLKKVAKMTEVEMVVEAPTERDN